MNDFITYKTSSPSGDLISFLAGIQQMHKETGKKGIVYQRLNMVGVGYADAIHPYSNQEGEPVAMTKEVFDMLVPLLRSQDYIEDYRIYNGEQIDMDFDLIRLERYTGQPNTSLARWYSYVFPQMSSDLSKPHLKIYGKKPNGKVVINFTQRYRNHIICYNFLREYQDKIIFAGIKKERDLFCEQWGLDIPLLQVNDFLELARIINNSLFFLGNASMCFQIAEALKVPRILETFPRMPNVIPTGENAFDYYGQSEVEFYFRKLINIK